MSKRARTSANELNKFISAKLSKLRASSTKITPVSVSDSTISGSTVHPIQLTSDEEPSFKEPKSPDPMEHKQSVREKNLTQERPQEKESEIELTVPNYRKRKMTISRA